MLRVFNVREGDATILDSFASRLSDLRKQRDLRQKEAAQALGVSQALLSHYENGIRECGLDFIAKAAKFYGVTCDYLLCASNSKYGFFETLDFRNELEDDSVLTNATIYRAAGALREALGNTNEDFVRQTLVLYSICIYRVFLFAVSKGRAPANWIKVGCALDFEMYLNAVDSLLLLILDVPAKKINLKYDFEQGVPECLKTVIDAAHDALADRVDLLSDIMTKRFFKDSEDYKKTGK